MRRLPALIRKAEEDHDRPAGEELLQVAAQALELGDELEPELAHTWAAGIEGADLHSLRHTFASVGAHPQNGRFANHVGPLLGHGFTKRRGITERYIHDARDALRPAADAIAAEIAALLRVSGRGRVVAFPAGSRRT